MRILIRQGRSESCHSEVGVHHVALRAADRREDSRREAEVNH